MTIKALILGAGYGTRLQRDLESDPTHHHLLGVPKALLPLGDRDCLITHWLDRLTACGFSKQDDIYIVTNQASYRAFQEWADRHDVPPTHILNDGTMTNETRLGAVPDILFGWDAIGVDSNLLVIGGDTLFLNDFDLPHFFAQKQPGQCLVTTYTVNSDHIHKVGIVQVDQGRITCFMEKPSPTQTDARQACPCFYLLDRAAAPLIRDFLVASKGYGLEHYDATGKALTWLYPRIPVYTYPISGRIDVGGLQSYIDANNYFKDSATG